MMQHTLLFPFIQHYVSRQEIIEITEIYYDKNLHNCNDHNCFVLLILEQILIMKWMRKYVDLYSKTYLGYNIFYRYHIYTIKQIW